MSGNTANPRIWINGDVLTAPAGTTEPTDVSAAWPAGWAALGLLSEDGATEARDESTDDKYAWGGILVRTTRSKHKRTIKVIALEDNPTVFGLVNPGSSAVTATGVTTRTVKVPNTPNRRAFGIEVKDGNTIKRRVIPDGEVTEVGEVAFSDEEMTGYELTITIYPDASGVLYRDITNDAQAAV